MRDSYTRYPRAILWLIRGGCLEVQSEAGSRTVEVGSFYISKLPITNLQYEAFDPAHPRPAIAPGDDDPVVEVDLQQATAYCDWYARVSRKPMRLPTDDEWTFACSGSQTGFIWHRGNSDSQRVPDLRAARPGAVGLHAMLGGVWEWVDCKSRQGPPRIRGGSFRVDEERFTREAGEIHESVDPGTRRVDLGFRVARSL